MAELSSPITLLETPRLILRAVTPEIYRELFTLHTDAEAEAFLGPIWQQERAKYRNGVTTFHKSFLWFQMITKEDRQLIGSCGFHTWYLQHDRAEIGYAITEESNWGKGYMKEAIAPVIGYGFGPMQLNRIEAFVGTANKASQRLLQGLGFREEGMLRKHYIKDGVAEDSLVFGLLQSEYQPV